MTDHRQQQQHLQASRWRKRSVVIEAMRFMGRGTEDAILAWIDGPLASYNTAAGSEAPIKISTLEGCMEATPGDWIIRGVQGEFYPCKPDIFEATYDWLCPRGCHSKGVQPELLEPDLMDRLQESLRLVEHRGPVGTAPPGGLDVAASHDAMTQSLHHEDDTSVLAVAGGIDPRKVAFVANIALTAERTRIAAALRERIALCPRDSYDRPVYEWCLALTEGELST